LRPSRPDWAKGIAARWLPGEKAADRRLAGFLENDLAHYVKLRDRPGCNKTSSLSPYLHFGELSPNQVWYAALARNAASPAADGATAKFLSEIGWREFSYHLLADFPALPAKPLRPEFAQMPWRKSPADLSAWRRGLTGYPIVDAGMRELWQTGVMHNRVRMIAASFLIKDLMLDWRSGLMWFWDTLVDADEASNSASWQWVAGCGADASPYYRIFNPVLQGRKFDPDGVYVRRYVPEIARLPDALLHAPWEAPEAVLAQAGVRLGESYPLPIVDHAKARLAALAAFEGIKKG
jgi:deoxyribodipyrimidine photo-lyase